MFLPNKLFLQRLVCQNVYCDKSSLENKTEVVKKKYKLAGEILKPFEVYTFFIATGEKSACNSHTTIEVEQQHWENKVSGHLMKDKGYIDLHKVEALSGDEICNKMRDKTNRFSAIARLCDKKYLELRSLSCNIHKYTNASTGDIALAGLAIGIYNTFSISDRILKNLGLN